MRRALVALGLGLVAVVVSATGALAAPAASLTVQPSQVSRGSDVTVAGRCEPNTTGEVISRAFRHDATHDFAGVGAVAFSTGPSGRFSVLALVPSTRPVGTYSVTARCGGGTLGISRRLTVVAATLPRTGPGDLLRMSALGLLLLTLGTALVGLDLSRRRPPARSR